MEPLTPLQKQLCAVRESLPSGVALVAVSKFHPAECIREAYAVGQRIFGESRVQELQQKVPQLPADIEWHFIGHLQQNKVKYIAPYVALIHAVDSFSLLAEINKQAAKHDRVVRCLLQLHVAQEESKFGLSLEDCRALLAEGHWRELTHVQIVGLMCMATFTDDTDIVRREFGVAQSFFAEVKSSYFATDDQFAVCSWGMSDDYPLAIEAGSTMVRVGSKIFGARQ